MTKLIVNLGCGEMPIAGAVNVDFSPGRYVDEVADLTRTPWKWRDNSVDGIYMIHVLEHFPDDHAVLRECYRILKPGGFLYLEVPHSSNVLHTGNLGHFHVYSYNTFRDYLSRNWYLFGEAKFETVYQEIAWWTAYRNPELTFARPAPTGYRWWARAIGWAAHKVINRLIRFSPRMFERHWCYFVGGADEVRWKGLKIPEAVGGSPATK